jgi:hypothetical protein
MNLDLIRAGGSGGGSGVSSVQHIYPPNPAAGAELILQSPGGTVRVLGMTLVFAAIDITGGQRLPSFTLYDVPSGQFIRVWTVKEGIVDAGVSGPDLGAFVFSVNNQRGLGLGADRHASAIGSFWFLDADFYLKAGEVEFATYTSGMQPGDQWGITGGMFIQT